MKPSNKSDLLNELLIQLNNEFETDMAVLYDKLLGDSLAHKNRIDGVRNNIEKNEAELFPQYVRNKRNYIRESYISCIQKVMCQGAPQYTKSQAVNMWKPIENKVTHPKIKKFDVDWVANLLEKGTVYSNDGHYNSSNRAADNSGGRLTEKDKAVLCFFFIGLCGLGLAKVTASVAVLSKFFLISGGALALLSGGIAIHQCIKDDRCICKGLFDNRADVLMKQKSGEINEDLIKKCLEIKKNDTVAILKKWAEEIIETAVSEEPVL